jgi:hypothetical protein
VDAAHGQATIRDGTTAALLNSCLPAALAEAITDPLTKTRLIAASAVTGNIWPFLRDRSKRRPTPDAPIYHLYAIACRFPRSEWPLRL